MQIFLFINTDNYDNAASQGGGRLSRLSLELTNPIRQKPFVILFVGRERKDLALHDF